MIYDKLSNIEHYKTLSKNFEVAIDYILNTDLDEFEVGKYEIDGDNSYFMIQEYPVKEQVDANFESHLLYADIQIILSGDELIGFSAQYDQVGKVVEDKFDYILYKDKPDFFIPVSKNEFVICLKEDLHMACVRNNSDRVKKAVVKVKL